jgi:hypothetical protein
MNQHNLYKEWIEGHEEQESALRKSAERARFFAENPNTLYTQDQVLAEEKLLNIQADVHRDIVHTARAKIRHRVSIV